MNTVEFATLQTLACLLAGSKTNATSNLETKAAELRFNVERTCNRRPSTCEMAAAAGPGAAEGAQHVLKVMVIGDAAVGKTSIIKQ